ncbi:hypothetical protein [Streptomyces sp. NPDC001750]|uniref:hypothetical protein n=1 Tax=Streptomyces sp. NPDC001750 TaxID=3364607 RepID=UPI00369BED3B
MVFSLKKTERPQYLGCTFSAALGSAIADQPCWDTSIVMPSVWLDASKPDRRFSKDAGPHIAGHVAYLERHLAAGTFLVSGQTIPTQDGGAIIAHGVDRDTSWSGRSDRPGESAG